MKFDGNFYTVTTNPSTCDRVTCSVTMKRTYKMINEFLDSRSNTIPTSPVSLAADAINCWAAACKSTEVHFYLRMRAKLCDVCIRRNEIVCHTCFYFSRVVLHTLNKTLTLYSNMRTTLEINLFKSLVTPLSKSVQ